MAEEEFNNRIRYKDMIEREEATLLDNCVVLPDYWLDIETIKFVGGKFLDYVPREEYNRKLDSQSENPYYTIVGNTLFVAPAVDADLGTTIELALYTKIEPLGEDSNWLLDNHPSVYIYTTLKHAAPFLDEDERLGTWATLSDNAINAMNESWRRMKYASGKPLRMKIRSFG
jgi:hypothetical protein